MHHKFKHAYRNLLNPHNDNIKINNSLDIRSTDGLLYKSIYKSIHKPLSMAVDVDPAHIAKFFVNMVISGVHHNEPRLNSNHFIWDWREDDYFSSMIRAMNEIFGFEFAYGGNHERTNREYIHKNSVFIESSIIRFYNKHIRSIAKDVPRKSNHDLTFLVVIDHDEELVKLKKHQLFGISQHNIIEIGNHDVDDNDILGVLSNRNFMRVDRGMLKCGSCDAQDNFFTGVVISVNKYGVCRIESYETFDKEYSMKRFDRDDIDDVAFVDIQDQMEDKGGVMRVDDRWDEYMEESSFFVSCDGIDDEYWDPINGVWVVADRDDVEDVDGYEIDKDSYKQLAGQTPEDFVDKDFVTKNLSYLPVYIANIEGADVSIPRPEEADEFVVKQKIELYDDQGRLDGYDYERLDLYDLYELVFGHPHPSMNESVLLTTKYKSLYKFL